jgi:hypothetical protein
MRTPQCTGRYGAFLVAFIVLQQLRLKRVELRGEKLSPDRRGSCHCRVLLSLGDRIARGLPGPIEIVERAVHGRQVHVVVDEVSLRYPRAVVERQLLGDTMRVGDAVRFVDKLLHGATVEPLNVLPLDAAASSVMY